MKMELKFAIQTRTRMILNALTTQEVTSLLLPVFKFIISNICFLVLVGLLNTLKHECGHCDNLCDDIAYHSQTTTSRLQNASDLWKDVDTKKTGMNVPKWYNKKFIIQILCFHCSQKTIFFKIIGRITK